MNSQNVQESAENFSSQYNEDEIIELSNEKGHRQNQYNRKDYSSQTNKKYFILSKRSEYIPVNKKYFDTHKKYVKKVVTDDGVIYYSVQKKFKDKQYTPQGLFGIPSILRDIMSKIKVVRAAVQESGSAHMNAFILDFATLVADMWGYHSLASWGIIICRMYSLIIRAVDFSHNVPQSFEPQSFADFSIMVAMLGLPKELIEKIRVFQTLVTSKLTSSTWLMTALRQFVKLVRDVLDYVLAKYPENTIVQYVNKFITDQFSFIWYLEEAESISRLYSKYIKNSQVIFDLKYRQEVLAKEEKLNDVGFLEFLNISEFRHFKDIVNAFKANVIKYVKTFTVSSRVEPVCFVLEGPAGCRKSIFMNQLVQMCQADNRSVYTHTIPSVEDSKDFYDDYENQEVFVIDDLGQQGLSQWRTIINFVAPVKLPLNCAAAEKKNTKFFNSDLILATTNLFSNIQSFTPKDCITSKEALFRRVHLIKFEGHKNTYTLSYNKFNYTQAHPEWEKRFIDIMEGVELPTHIKVNVNNTESVKSALVWMYSIIKIAGERNKENAMKSEFTDSELKDLLSRVEDTMYMDAVMMPEMFHVPAELRCEEEADEYVALHVGWQRDMISWEGIVEYVRVKSLDAIMWWMGKMRSDNPVEYWFARGLFSAIYIMLFFMVRALVAKIKDVVCSPKLVEDFYQIQSEKGAEDLNDNQTRIKRNHQYIVKCISEINGERVEQAAVCFLTGNYMLLNDHLVGKDPVFNIYKDFNAMLNNHVMFNNLPYEIVRRFRDEDICVCRCSKFTVTPIKIYGDYVRYNSSIRDTDKCMYVSNPAFTMPLINKINCRASVSGISYSSKEYTYRIKPEDAIKYDLTKSGLCGSILMDHNGNPCGHHVCGNSVEGVLKIWSSEFLSYFLSLSKNKDAHNGVFTYVNKDKVKENFSGLRVFQDDLTPGQASGKSTIIPSDLYNIREEITQELVELEKVGFVLPTVLKAPANLSVYGKDTIIKMAEKSFKVIPSIDPKHMSYVKECLKTLMPKEKFSKIDELVAAFGGEGLNSMNKDSANGYGYKKSKEEYLDYTNKIIKPEFKIKIEKFKEDVLSNKVTIDQLLCKEALKDELRTDVKVDKPRTFRVLPLHHTFLVKQYLGKFFTFLRDNMWENGIAIGMNPYLDFDRLYKKLRMMNITFDGDFGSYDGSAPSQIQDMIAELVLEYFEGSEEDKMILKVLLDSMIRSWVLTREKLTLTTHSMPSGCWVTALFNSLLNRALTALCISMFSDAPTVADFTCVVDFVLGDDKIVGVPLRLAKVINAINMRKVAESLGMTYTDAHKGEIVESSKPLEECQFLKRTFSFNRQIGKVVGVLDMNTIIETLRYYSRAKVYEEVMNGKMTAVQFELFLYGTAAIPLKEKIMRLAEAEGIEFQRFSDEVILKTMLDRNAYAVMLSSLDKYNFLI